MGRRLKDQKEKKKQETRTRNAEIHAAVSVAGVAAAVAANAASNAVAAAEHTVESTAVAAAVASAAALIASHCIEMAGEIGAGYNQIETAVSSATNARTNGDVMALTASAATGSNYYYITYYLFITMEAFILFLWFIISYKSEVNF